MKKKKASASIEEKYKKKIEKVKAEAAVEFQNPIGEINSGGYKAIRFSKLKYKKNSDIYIDIRSYQRGYDDEGENIYYPTKIGFRFTERQFLKVVNEYTLLPSTYVHPGIAKKSFPLLQEGQFESAVLQAFKILEITLRKKTGAKAEDVGVSLIRKAFHQETGTLTDFELPVAEREAFAHYMAGAFGYYKNPCAHRDVEMDYIQAFERIVVASDLLKAIEKREMKK